MIKNKIDFLVYQERLNNWNFNPIEFKGFKKQQVGLKKGKTK